MRCTILWGSSRPFDLGGDVGSWLNGGDWLVQRGIEDVSLAALMLGLWWIELFDRPGLREGCQVGRCGKLRASQRPFLINQYQSIQDPTTANTANLK